MSGTQYEYMWNIFIRNEIQFSQIDIAGPRKITNIMNHEIFRGPNLTRNFSKFYLFLGLIWKK